MWMKENDWKIYIKNWCIFSVKISYGERENNWKSPGEEKVTREEERTVLRVRGIFQLVEYLYIVHLEKFNSFDFNTVLCVYWEIKDGSEYIWIELFQTRVISTDIIQKMPLAAHQEQLQGKVQSANKHRSTIGKLPCKHNVPYIN